MSADTVDMRVSSVPSGVDDAVGMSCRKWFVAIVNSRHEKSVATKLSNIGVENYVAIQKEMRRWSNGRRRIIDRVVIPSVVFVRCTEYQRRSIVTLSYINRFMVNRMADSGSFNKPVAVIRDEEINKLKFILGQSDYLVDFVSDIFQVDDNVRVVRGALRGLTGSIMEGSDGEHTLLVSVPLLGGATIHINPREVEKIPKDCHSKFI